MSDNKYATVKVHLKRVGREYPPNEITGRYDTMTDARVACRYTPDWYEGAWHIEDARRLVNHGE